MANWPASEHLNQLVTHPWSDESLGRALDNFGIAFNNLISATYPVANLAIYIPFLATKRLLVVKLLAWNGSAVSGNIDVGVYDQEGNRVVSAGSTAQAGTSVLQVFDVTDTAIGPGLYYLAVALDNTTGTLFRRAPGLADHLRMLGVFQEASAFPLPATATFATYAQTYIPGIAVTTRVLV